MEAFRPLEIEGPAYNRFVSIVNQRQVLILALIEPAGLLISNPAGSRAASEKSSVFNSILTLRVHFQRLRIGRSSASCHPAVRYNLKRPAKTISTGNQEDQTSP